jgi:hypothetical protein
VTAALPLPTIAEPAAATNSGGLVSHFTNDSLETVYVYPKSQDGYKRV